MTEEDYESILFSKWLSVRGIWHTHIANERSTSIAHGAKLKRMGVSRGVPDYMIIVNAKQSKINKASLVFIELKRKRKILKSGNKSKTNLLTKEQKDWINKLNEVKNINAYVCYGGDSAIELIDVFFLKKNT